MTTPSTPKTADEFAAVLYTQMKAPSPARALYDAVQAATPADAAGLIAAAPADLQRDLAAYTHRRAQLVSEHAEYAEDVHNREEWEAWCNRVPKTRWGALKRFYRNGHVGNMVDDFGWTLNPKRANTGGSVRIPFRLWPRQFELVDWMWKHYREATPGVCPKGRELGVSWLAMAFSACICVLFKDVVVGVVASTEDKLDSSKDPSPTLPKAREFLMGIPEPLRAGFDNTVTTAPYLKVVLPETGSLIRGWTGTGDQGRGARAACVVIDEAHFFDNPHALDASLSAVSDCLLYFSSANGTQGTFYAKVASDAFDTFWFRIDQDPRKTPEWIEAKKRVTDSVVWASEYMINFHASVESQLIEWKWVEASVGLLQLLQKRDGFQNTGSRLAALDVSDQGKDKNCFAALHGVELTHLELWSGAGSDQHETCRRAFDLCDQHGAIRDLAYDGSAPGAGIAGAARIINGTRTKGKISVMKFIGGSTDFPNPSSRARGTDRAVEDFCQNLKALSYWNLRQRFIESFKAFNGEPYDADFVLCIRKDLPNLTLLQNELMGIQRAVSHTDKLLIDKQAARPGQPKPKSPNASDALAMVAGGCVRVALCFNPDLLEALGAPTSYAQSFSRGY